MNAKKRKLTAICALHYVKLVYRSLLLLLAATIYITSKANNTGDILDGYEHGHWLLAIVWIVYVVEMACRFFPSRLESMGCQKQFSRNFKETEQKEIKLGTWRSTLLVAVVWLLLNGIFAALYYLSVIDTGILVLISLAYGVCDMICILFFCPFQTWIMKNRCCTVCRIYNWDFAMMFTPLIFVNSIYAQSLLFLSLLLLLRWEITVFKRPERFSEKTNACLSCKNCEEKLCHHKTQLQSFWEKSKARFKLK